MEDQAVIGIVWGAVLTGFIGFLFTRINQARNDEKDAANKRDAKIDALKDRVTKIEAILVDDEKVRRIVNDSLAPVLANQSETKQDVKLIMSEVHELTNMIASMNIGQR